MKYNSRKNIKKIKRKASHKTRRIQRGGSPSTSNTVLHGAQQESRGYHTAGLTMLALALVSGTAAIGFIALKGDIN